MARITAAWRESFDEFEEFVAELVENPFWGLSLRKGSNDNISEKAMTVKLPRHRWALGSAPDERMSWASVYDPLRKMVKLLFTNYPKGYLAFIASSDGDIKEIVFVPKGESYQRAAIDKGKNKGEVPDVVLLAVHKSHDILRFKRKVDSLVTSAWYVPLTAPLDLSLYIDKAIKEKLRNRHKGTVRV